MSEKYNGHQTILEKVSLAVIYTYKHALNLVDWYSITK